MAGQSRVGNLFPSLARLKAEATVQDDLNGIEILSSLEVDMFTMRFLSVLVLTATMGLAGNRSVASEDKAKEAAKEAKPQVEVVFCLDTTGSMVGLLEGAKSKIFSIYNQIISGKPAPALKVGLIAYRDRGDAYVTKVLDLTDDLDAVFGELKGFRADGGGDQPEAVNEALHAAVHKIKWSESNKTLKIIFLVGDAAPHMDYEDDVKYPETCKEACKKGIIINSIQCGSDPDCAKHWKEICTKAEGTYAQIAQDGGVQVAVATPFDEELAKLNQEMARQIIIFGDAQDQADAKNKQYRAKNLPRAEAAERAICMAKDCRLAAFDLIDAVKSGAVKLENIKPEQLPEELRKMKSDELKAHLDKVEAERTELRKKAVELDRKRSEFIQKKLAEDKGNKKDGFDEQVLETLRKQAKKHAINY